jgi:hypothetical protein
MKKSIAMKWADALESGEYMQGTGSLRSDQNEFCCLGVLCNLHAQKHKKIAKEQTDAEEYFGASEFPPELVWSGWAGMKTSSGTFVTRPAEDEDDWDETDDLASINDGGANFKKIANIIREKYKEL